MIQRAVAGGPHEVGTERGLEDYILPPAPQLEQHVLRDIFGGGALPQEPEGDPDELGVVGAEDGVECTLVLGLKPL